MLKPLRPAEVVARLNTRREELNSRNNANIITFGDLTIDLRHKLISGAKGKAYQPPREMDLLAYLVRACGTVVEKEALKRHVWGNISVSSNALDRKLFEVRKAVRQVSDQVELKAVYGKGITLRLTSYEEDQILLEDKELVIQRQPETTPP